MTFYIYFGTNNSVEMTYHSLRYIYIFFFCGAATQRGSWPPHF